jgi:5-methylcytosine-specific restriction endonuclease McrA
VIFLDRCVVLNGDYSFLNFVGWRRAVCLFLKGKGEVLKWSDKAIKLIDGSEIKIPLIMRLIKLVRNIYRNKVPFSKRNVMIRDGFKCGYCSTPSDLTIDHIIPTSKGGKTTFENCITACHPCNHKKRDKSPREAGMFIKKKAYAPTISEFIMIKMKQLGLQEIINDLWENK